MKKLISKEVNQSLESQVSAFCYDTIPVALFLHPYEVRRQLNPITTGFSSKKEEVKKRKLKQGDAKKS